MILAVSKRWHLWRYRLARWALARVVTPAWARLDAIVKQAAGQANDQHDKARLRMEICKRCPAFDQTLRRCRDCGCFMPAKVQIDAAKCPQGRW